MYTCPLLELCKCDGAHICLFCKILTLIGIAIVSGIAGYAIGKKKRSKPGPKAEK